MNSKPIWNGTMGKAVTFIANGKEIKANEGDVLLQVLLDNGIEVPHFCYHEAVGVDGNCRMCMVEIEGFKRPQISCDTLVKEGMVVRTEGKNINEVKRSILELELINHPVDCPICDQAGECKLQDYYMQTGLYESQLSTQKVHKKKHIDLGSNVMLDQERCVLCARCSRFTSKITKTGELGIMGRGDHSYLGTMPGRKLDNPYAMNVVDLCPVGALTSKDFRFRQRVWFLKPADSVCQECAKGCNITIDHNREKYKDDIVYRFRPRMNKNVNGYFMCDHGRLSYHKENEKRQEEPLLADEIRDTDTVLDSLKRVLEENRERISILISPSTSLEDAMAIKLLSEKYSADIFCDSNAYLEGDDDGFLIRADKASNRAGMELIGIDMGKVKENRLIINVNHKNIIRNVDLKTVEFLTHAREGGTEITIPIASFSEQQGSVINCDGYLQRMEKAVTKNRPALTMLEIVQRVLEREIDIYKELQNIEAFSDISWQKIGKTGMKIR